MKRYLLLVFALALLAPWATQAQTPNATVPYSTGFETGDDCSWDLIVGTVTNRWVIDTAVHNMGSRSLYISKDYGVHNSYALSATSVCYAARTFTLTETGTPYVISFDWKASGEGSYDYLRCFLVPGNVVLTAGTTLPEGMGATGTPQNWIDLGGEMNLSNGNWMNTTVQFSIATPGDYKVVFVWRNDNSGGVQPPAAVDNVQLAVVSCPSPALSFTSLTSTSVTVDVSSAATSFVASMDGVNWEAFYGTSLLVDTLTPQTNYMLRVRAICGDGDTSFAGTLSFMTPCTAIPADSLPFVYGFEDATASGSSGSYNPCWGRHVQGTSTAYPYPFNSFHHSGNYSLYLYSSASVQSWTTLPQFETPVNGLYLTFWVYKNSASYGHLAVGVMSDPNDLSTFDTIDLVQPDNVGTWEFVEIPLTGYTGGGTFVALVSNSPSTDYVYIDDITVSLPPACPRPTQVIATDITASSATLSWTNNAALSSEFIVEYGLHGFAQGYGTTVAAVGTSVVLNNLRMGMTYDAYVVAICGDDTSTVALGTFGIGCSEISASDMPFTEDFESYGSGFSYPISPCWTKGTNAASNWPYPSASAAIDGTRGLFFYGSTSSTDAYYSWAALPPIEEGLDMSDLMVRFKAKRYSAATIQSIICVGIATSDTVSSVTDVTWIDTIDLSSAAVSSIQEIEVSFSQYTGTGRYVVFYAPNPVKTGTNTVYNYIFLDDITLTVIPVCFRPEEVTVDHVGADQATLSWTPNPLTANPSSWYVEYGLHGFTLGEGTSVSSTSCTVTLTGLTPGTWYDVHVSADCGAGMSDARSTDFITGAEAAELPYVTGFEAGQDTGWVFYNMGYPNYWMIGGGATAVASGSRALFITNNGTDNAYTSSSSPSSVYAIRYLNIEEGGNYTVSFDWKANGETSWDYLRAFLVPDNYMIVPGDMNGISATATPEGWINVGSYNGAVKLNLSTTWHTSISEITVPDSLAGIFKLVFFWRNDNSGGQQPPASIDNVSVTVLTCARPFDVTASGITDSSFTLTWDGNAASYQVALSTESVNPDSVSGITIYTVFGDSITLTGLTPNTPYYYYVRSLCGVDGNSEWSVEGVVRTNCGPLSVPYTEDFESYGTGATQPISPCWFKGTNSSIAYPYPYSTHAVSGNRSLFFYAYHPSTTASTAIYSYAALPLFQYPVSDLMLSFKVRRYATETDDVTTRLVIGVMSDPTDIATFSPLDTLDLKDEEGASVHNYEYFFDGYTGTAQYIAIYDEAPPLYGAASYCASYAYVDDVTVDLIASCLNPVNVTSVAATNTSVSLDWTDRSTPAAWEVEYTGNGVTATTVVSATPAVLTGLTPATSYDVRVRAICDAGDTSVWSENVTVATDTGALVCAAPVIDTAIVGETEVYFNWSGSASAYEVAAVAGNWAEPAAPTTVTDYYATVAGLTPGTQYSIGVRAVCDEDFYSVWVVTTITTEEHPCIAPALAGVSNITLSSAIVSWVPGEEGQTDFQLRVTTGGGSSVIDVTGQSYEFTGLFNNTEYTVEVRAVCGEGRYSEWSNPMTFTTLDCLPVSGVNVGTVSSTSATITWTSNGSSSYEVGYGPIGTTTDNCTRRTTTTASYTITGLEEGFTYVVYVRSICAEGVYSDWTNGTTFTTETQGIDDVDNAGISLYPNPASSTVTLAGIEGESTVTVVDMNGRQVYTGNTVGDSLTIDLGGMAQGAYFVRITGERVNAIRKLIVR